MTSATDLPQELCYDPMSFVVLTGLDIKYNAIHKSIWDAFSNNRRADRVPISFGCLPGDHCYPRCKDKRTSYEWYIPKGILKTKWMDKHLHQVPAVVVIFYELDWDEPAWREKQLECASRVEVVRTSLQGRGTKVAVVLIQKSTPLPPGEDMVAAERAAALCSSCDLSAKSLFVLPHTDHLLGYIIRLENAFYELANSYYHTEARKVKVHKEFLNKTTHQLLFPRHQFKIGFFNELMQDPANAVKHYRQAYNHIHELRSHDTNNLEVKVMGGFISYKICRLCFLRLNTPLEAISQFRRHIDLFKPKTGNAELMFEHSAWMSKQFTVFGDLFDEAIKAGLAAIQTQHPGFYYQQAAYHAQERRMQARKLCAVVTEQEYPAADPLDTGGQPLDFYGQRPWRQGHQSIDPPDANKERDGKLALKHQEATIDHSWLIIPLLSSAVAQFKKYKCPRMKRFLTVQMGEEYYHAQDYSKAATLLSHTAWDYRNNRWWDILHRILTLTLRCSYSIANIQQYIATSLELLGRYCKVCDEEKTRIQMNLIRVISGKSPEPEHLTFLDKGEIVSYENDHVEALDAAKMLWNKAVADPKVYSIELNNLVPFMECKTNFASDYFEANVLVTLNVYIRTSCPFPMRFFQLVVSLGKQVYDEHCIITDSTLTQQDSGSFGNTGDLYFESQKFKCLSFSFPPDPADVGKSIEISSITLKLGGDRDGNCAVLVWNMSDPLMPHDLTDSVIGGKCVSSKERCPKKWDDIQSVTRCDIKQRQPLVKLDIFQEPPSLINEIYRIQINVLSEESDTCENVRSIIRLEPGLSEEIFRSTFMAVDANSVLSCPATKALEVNFGNLPPGERVCREIFILATKSGLRKLSVCIIYEIRDEITPRKSEMSQAKINCICSQELSVSFDAVPAFQLTSETVSKSFDLLKSVQLGSSFLVAIHVDCQSPWPIELNGGKLTLKSDIVTKLNGMKSEALTSVRLEQGESASDAMCLRCNNDIKSNTSNIQLGEYTLEWRRYSETDSPLPFVSSTVELSSIAVKSFPLTLDVELPSYGVVGKEISFLLKLCNSSNEQRELELQCDVAENFMFSGVKLQRCRILPGFTVNLTYALYPLVSGFQTLPAFHVKEIPSPGDSDANMDMMPCAYLEESIPKCIFVKPCGKD